MKLTVFQFILKPALLLVFITEYAFLSAQAYQETKATGKQEIHDLNKALLADKQKQAELWQFYRESFIEPPQLNDTVSLYLADLDAVIAIGQKHNISYPIKLMEDCRDLIRSDLRELTMNGVRSGYSFKKIAITNDEYLKEVFTHYKLNYRPGWKYGRRMPEFGREDYLKAIQNIFTTIVTLRVNSLVENVHVVVYALQDNKFVARGSGKTELIQALESGNYLVELSKPGFRKKVKKVALGKYPKTLILNEPLVMQ